MQTNRTAGRTAHVTVVGIFPSQPGAKSALSRLNSSNLAIDDISIIERDSDRFDPQYDYSTVDYTYHQSSTEEFGERTAGGMLVGGLTGGTLGTLVGLGTLTIPGIGPLVAVGPLVGALTGGAAGALAGTFVGALMDAFQMPEEHAEVYSERLTKGHIMLAVLVEQRDALDVQVILRDAGAERFEWREDTEERPYYWA